MKRLIPALAAAALALPVAAVEYGTPDTAKSALSFTTKQMGVPVDGKFNRFKVTLNFDPAAVQKASAGFELELASIDAGSKEANDEVVGKDWFNVKQFPTAVFKSTAVKALGGNKFEVSGPLTIKGRTQTVTAPFTYKAEGSNGVFDGAFTIKRLQFGVGEGPWGDTSTVADEVLIKFHLIAAARK
ncbi:YceI family protein [Niveibacterium umoris]|uniref:Polyisoprenoid-binding protein YceI n=1 Tax=Niveibacterium umoris TaxID=1193620 RepID=A0A840BQU0_9RHOO|nr:YceI family protein [Niveibacterium umoris]MBB4013176.1 polyisoprenoid-binding protein YceI [Niveibacterium umoris]